MELDKFLDIGKLGTQFLAVKGYEEVRDRKNNELTAYKLDISIQDPASIFYYELFTVKVKNLSPTISVSQLKNASTTPVELVDLNMGQFNGSLWFNCSDVVPTTKK